MAGLVPAIHVLTAANLKFVDARHRAGHDEALGTAGAGIRYSLPLSPPLDLPSLASAASMAIFLMPATPASKMPSMAFLASSSLAPFA
jgi:hypothetical protein